MIFFMFFPLGPMIRLGTMKDLSFGGSISNLHVIAVKGCFFFFMGKLCLVEGFLDL